MLSYSESSKINKQEKLDGQVWIKNRKVDFTSESGLGLPPAINPCEGVKLVINGMECSHLVVPGKDDVIEIKPETIIREELIEIKISEDEMEAVLHTIPARISRYEVLDCEPSNLLELKALEVIENVGYISEEKIYSALEKHGITTGIIEENIKQACSTYEDKYIIAARGTQVTPPEDAWIEYMFSQEKFEINLNEDEAGRVDFRNFIDYKSSGIGDVLAVKHPMKPGADGITVTGKLIKTPMPKDIRLCDGDGVIIEENGKIARCIKAGKAEAVKSETAVSININEKLEINGDVDIKRGNIKFKGNVIVNGNVKEAMEVQAKGSIYVKGDSHFAEIKSGNSVAISGNVISSKVESGNRNIIIRDPGEDILPITESIDLIIQEIENSCKDKLVNTVYPDGIGPKVKELLNSKYHKLPQDIYAFIVALKTNQYDCLIEKRDQLISALKIFLGNCSAVKTIEQLYKVKAILNGLTYYTQDDTIVEGDIILMYAANSEINARGCVKITEKGCFNCDIRANDKILINGVVRGSVIHSEKMIEVNQVGSEMGVPTTISVPPNGVIKIKRIYNDNIIKVGAFTHRFIDTETDIYARIVDGKLVLR